LEELTRVLKEHRDISVVTVTANGEPTLYPHLGELIDGINRVKGRSRSLILSNSSTISDRNIQDILARFDTVKLSLDCATARCLKRLDRAENSIDIEDIKRGIVEFSEKFKNELILEILFVKGINDSDIEISKLNSFLETLDGVTRVDIGSIDRPPAYGVEGIDYQSLREISLKFGSKVPINITSRVYSRNMDSSNYSREDILDTIRKRPLTQEDIDILFNETSKAIFQDMVGSYIDRVSRGSYTFFTIKGGK